MEKLDRKDLRFVLACVVAIAAGAAVTAGLFRRAFPEAEIRFEVNREGARKLGEAFLESRGARLAGTRFAGRFAVDETPKVYLERELGLESAGRLYGRAAKVWQWQMRWFRSGEKEEQRATFSPLGELIGFESVLPEDAPGARLPREAARGLAVEFLATRGLAESDLEPIEATPVSRPNRTDWTFVDQKRGVRFADATLRYSTTVSGERVTAHHEFVHVPEAWERDYQKLRARNEAAGSVATFGLFVTVLAMLGVLVAKIAGKDVPWRLVAGFGGVGFVLALLSFLNEIPLTLFEYDTASPLSAYLTKNVVLGILAAIGTGAGIALVVASAEPMYRERFPRQMSLGGAFSLRGIQTKSYFRSVLLGYALTAFFFAYQAVFYVVAGRFGAWSPADVPYSDMLNTWFPWATVLLIGFLPAVSEEGISRMFSISFLDRLGAGRVIAIVLPAFIWGFGHAAYPNQPFYIRGLEVGLAGVLIGLLMLRYGVVPLLVWHFTVDAIYTALLLLRSGNTYYVVSGVIASGILLLPLLISFVAYARRGGFLPATGLSNADVGTAALPVPAPVPAAAVPGVRPLSRGALTYMGAAALVLVSSFFVPSRDEEPDVEDRTGRPAATALSRRFLQVNGADPEAWRSVLYFGTGFAGDAAVRAAKPQDFGGVPGFSDDAARYVIDHGGPDAFRKLAERDLPLAWWVARFYQPENKEEWKVLIDARRARVAAFVHPIAEDAPAGPPPDAETATRRAFAAAGKLGYDAASYTLLEVGTENRPRRVDTTVVLESRPKSVGEARPRLTAVFHGPSLAAFLPTIQVPETFLREQRKRSAAEWLLLGVRVVAIGALVGLAIVLFLRTVRQPGFRWKTVFRPLIWAGALSAAGLANTVPYLFRQYPTETPLALFRIGLGVSLTIGLLGLLLVAALGFALIEGARPGWTPALRRKGSLGDAMLRAAIAAAGLAGLARWFGIVASRIPALYEPDPTLPQSLALAVPGVDAVWAAGRGVFVIALAAAVAALALRDEFFRKPVGRALAIAAILVALLPGSANSPGDFAAGYLPDLLVTAWLGASAAFLLRDHPAAWALFGLLAFGGREALDMLIQPAASDRAAGGVAVALLAVAALPLIFRRQEAPAPAPSESLPGS